MLEVIVLLCLSIGVLVSAFVLIAEAETVRKLKRIDTLQKELIEMQKKYNAQLDWLAKEIEK